MPAPRRRVTRTQWAAGVAVVLALVFAGTAAVASAGRDSGSGASGARTPSSDSADAGFARDMAVHHQQAVEMSFIVRDSTDDEEIRRLAYDIANTQANQRGMLLGWLDLWGLPKLESGTEPMAWMAASASGDGDAHSSMDSMEGMADDHGAYEAHDGSLMAGMATRTELESLRKARGKQAEILYLQLMTDHHKGGVTMAQGCVQLCAVDTEKSLAAGMVAAQESEMKLMADLLAARGAKPRA
ncbi:DUF305 domain-containing protein [Streptomyces paludis]|uniref:DUF305 domain-containing protein n=1 Tax=Streptomyces paludis TaxID=2282738 RepID=A0A345I0F0_9ACTN|nr:DUF305 domain-containing protein [Streptomyces paludis]AXG82424.1 DUF305 domain-containing protein [Streptomyces paludis]